MDRSRKSFSEYSSLVVIAAAIICLLLMKDTGTTAAVCWLAVVFSVSYFLRPLIPINRLKLPDSGFGLSFGAGIFLCFYPAWTFSAVTGVEFADAVVYSSFVIMSVAGLAVRKFIYREDYARFFDFKKFLNGFAVFAVIFVAFFWVIGFNPSVDPGTENYMDFGFMQTIYRQKSAIPVDPWFAGTKLNYYYLGQSLSVYMCRLCHTTPEFGYNLMLCTFIGMVFMMVYELVSGVANCLVPKFSPKDLCVGAAGIFGGSIAAFAANPHWLLYGILAAPLSHMFGDGDHGYWFPDGTVYINTSTGDPDNGKNEFPAYSVILGDLHAHVINLIFVLPLLAILFDMCLTESDKDRDKELSTKSVAGHLLLISMLLGYYKGANYWDFAIYYVITGAVILFTDLGRKGIRAKMFLDFAAKALFVTVISIVSILPFTLNFIKMESGVYMCDNHSPFDKLAVLWLLPVAGTVCLIAFLYSKRGRDIVSNRTGCLGFLAFMLCTVGLVITPEIVYVKDIYGDANQRFNTMFKLTYQAFTLFAVIIGIAFAFVLYGVLAEHNRRKNMLMAVLFVVTAALSVSYTPYSSYQWFGKYWNSSARIGISSLRPLYADDFYSFEMESYDRLKDDDRKVLNIIEAAGDSYTHESALSVYSGACTPLGWYVHEWMWHNDPEPVRQRADSVRYFYCSGDIEYCREFLKQYDTDYILVGPAEVCKYAVNRNGFWNFGEPVADKIWQDCELSLIKVDKSRL